MPRFVVHSCLLLALVTCPAGAEEAQRHSMSVLGHFELEAGSEHPQSETLAMIATRSMRDSWVCFHYENNGLSPGPGKVTVKVVVDADEGQTVRTLRGESELSAFNMGECKTIARGVAEGALINSEFSFSRFPPVSRNGRMLIFVNFIEIPLESAGSDP